MISRLLAGGCALAMILFFLGYLAITVNQIPLWIIILIGVGMMLVDFSQSLRASEDEA